MRKSFVILLCAVCALVARAQTVPSMYRGVDQRAMNHRADSVFDAMTCDERIGQLFMVVADPKTDSPMLRCSCPHA